MAMYAQLPNGMTYEEATKILGTGVEMSSNQLAGITTVMYGWQNKDGSNMNAMFQDRKLVSKAQFGLR